MALNYDELTSVTNDYFASDGGRAIDIYFNSSFFMDHYMKQKKGYWKRYPGGIYIRVPLKYDIGEGGFYSRSGTLVSDDKKMVNSARFLAKHAYGCQAIAASVN